MTNEFQPFPHPDPFALPANWAFAGWPTQILFETRELLADESSTWLTSVATHINEVVMSNVDKLFDSAIGPRETLAHSERWPFSLHTQPGHIGVFAALEPGVSWDKLSPPTERWQRFAVFALMYTRDCLNILEKLGDQPSHESVPSGLSSKYVAMQLNDAGAFALEAMRALQIAHSLRIDTRKKSDRGRNAAVARHEAMKPKHTEALAMANSRPFTTKREAVDFIAENLTINAEGTKFCSRRAAGEWLSAAGWQPERKRNRT
ncbi:hypothetical protein BSY239_694 [Hydrogenophaga sp. RAC07]|uniref:hypothetical protein n=1 Tax=Hydrogenophaga sp. RAC07 TaxID=1842537 RepID=UPI00085796A4|nr:hypothetical protein [Hydrogenophaga sp. RAC07]AOF84648.1 hypothetical protein BSY239_694 [Hydrogenophaga sp. RAC07]